MNRIVRYILKLLKMAEYRHRKAERMFRALIENSLDGMAIMNVSGKPGYVSPAIEKILGYSQTDAMNLNLIELAHTDDVQKMTDLMALAVANPKLIHTTQVRMLHCNGSWRWIETSLKNCLGDPLIRGMVDNFRDVTDKRLNDTRMVVLNRLHAFTSQISQIILKAADEHTVYKEVCRIAIEVGKLRAAWIGIFNFKANTINLVEGCGSLPEDLSPFINAPYANEGPQKHVLDSGSYYVCQNIQKNPQLQTWASFASALSYHSCLVLPITKAGDIVGTFNLYALETDFFDDEEIALLVESVDNISFALDLFERERLKTIADELLKASENSLKQAQAVAHFGSWDINFSTGIASWSEETLRIYGLPTDQSKQTRDIWLSFTHPDDLAHVLNVTENAKASLNDIVFFHRIIRKDGIVRHLCSHARFQLSNNGAPTGLHGVTYDITESAQSEEALRVSEANIKAIIEHTDAAIYSLDRDFRYVIFNQKLISYMKDLYGIELKPGMHVFDFMQHSDPVEMKSWQDIYNRALEGESLDFEKEFIFEEHRNYTKFLISPIWKEGNVIGISCFVLDVSKQKEEESQKEKMSADLVQRNKDLEQFAYIISHNLRGPAANIIGLTEELSQEDHDPEVKDMFMKALATSVTQLDDVIIDLNQILQVKRDISEKKESVNLGQLISTIGIGMQMLIRKEHVIIKTDFTAVEEIFTLKSYVHSIFYNLISNSIKYRQPAKAPCIKITSRVVNRKVEITLQDNGSGIDMKKRGDQVFGLYKRFHPHIEGKGMGLFMVKTQVETLGGTIAVRSILNTGTEFIIAFDL